MIPSSVLCSTAAYQPTLSANLSLQARRYALDRMRQSLVSPSQKTIKQQQSNNRPCSLRVSKTALQVCAGHGEHASAGTVAPLQQRRALLLSGASLLSSTIMPKVASAGILDGGLTNAPCMMSLACAPGGDRPLMASPTR